MYSVIPIIIILWFFIAMFSTFVVSKATKKKTVSSDGHVVPKNQDLTCETEFEHKHPQTNEFGRRYIVHEEPEEGYVILNGIKRKLTDCKNL